MDYFWIGLALKILNIQTALASLPAEDPQECFHLICNSDSKVMIWTFKEEVDSLIRVTLYYYNLQHIHYLKGRLSADLIRQAHYYINSGQVL